MKEKVELRNILFKNVYDVLNLSPNEEQQRFCEPVAKTIAMAFAGNNEGCPGFLQAIYHNETPVGIILVGRSPVGKSEPKVLRKYKYVYRIWNLLIDKNYQRKGIGKAALALAFEKLKEYPHALQLPMYLECHKDNTAALSLYKLLGFQSINFTYSDDYCVLIRMNL